MSNHPPLYELREPASDSAWKSVENAGVVSLITQFQLLHAIHTVHKLGLASELLKAAKRGLEVESFVTKLDSYLVHHFLNYLEVMGLLVVRDGRVQIASDWAPYFSEVAGAQIGFYVEAYGPVISNMPYLLRGTRCYGVDV